jgi:hypothetical protein
MLSARRRPWHAQHQSSQLEQSLGRHEPELAWNSAQGTDVSNVLRVP